MAKKQTLGFGFFPSEAQQHFLVIVPPSRSEQSVTVFERFIWDEYDVQTSELPYEIVKNYNNMQENTLCKVDTPHNILSENGAGRIRQKIVLSAKKWNMVKVTLESEFNKVLKADNKKVGRFKAGMIPVERLLGKEMMVLLWAIEDCDPSVIENAIKNWCGLSREERWWLFTMTNAATGDYNEKHGWRIALRYALTDNPVDDKISQVDMFESLSQNF